MHPASGNDLKTVLLHRTAFLCVSRFLQLASIGTVNALMIAISVTFQPLFSVIPKIYINLENTGNTVSSTVLIGLKHCMENGTIHQGMTVMVTGFGVGLSWAGTMLSF